MKLTATILLLGAAAAWGQSAAWQEFSIGPPTRMQAGWPPNGIRAEGIPLKRAIARAYGVAENRVLGPNWIDDTRYAITGIVANPKDFQPLFQQELGRQFHMLVHRETRVVPVFVLRPLPEPNKLAAPSSASSAEMKADTRGLAGISFPRTTIPAFADMLGNIAGRPVIDETHLDNSFQVLLRWQSGSNSALQAAVRSQLGLDLVDENRGVDMLVIDHIEKLQFSK